MFISNKKLKLNKIFTYLIIYYWIMAYIQAPASGIGGVLLYIMNTFPVSLFIYIAIFSFKDIKASNEIIWLIIFMVFSIFFSIIRLDVSSITSIFLFGSFLIIIHKFEIATDLQLINRIFLLSIIISIPLFHSGYSIFGYLPGQSSTGNNIYLAGRVSMFPNVTVSMYFSLLVFLLNYSFNKDKYKRFFFMGASFYFVYFGISRTALIALSFIFILDFILIKFPVKNNITHKFVFPFFLIGIPVGMVFFLDNIIYFLVNLNSDFITSYFFKGYTDLDDILDDIARTSIWAEHIRIFLEHPLGLSTAEFDKYISVDLTLSDGGSESYLTRILMRYGFGAIFMYMFLFSLLNKAIKEKNKYLYKYVYLFIFIGLTYGSFFVVYNFLFLIFVSSTNVMVKK